MTFPKQLFLIPTLSYQENVAKIIVLKHVFDFSFFKKQNQKKTKPSSSSPQSKTKKKTQLSLEFHSNKKIPSFKQLKYFAMVLSKKELFIIRVFFVLALLSTVYLFASYYIRSTEKIPAHGGHYTEGMMGQPLYINPLFSQTSDVDGDITSLIFSSLLKYDKKQQLQGDLATSYDISEDHLQYIFHLRNDVYWHDGEKFNAQDVISTIDHILDPVYNSPLVLSFKGVKYEQINQYTIRFTLKKPFAPFPSVLTFGILPGHIWDQIEPNTARIAEYNLKPIGTGPWVFSSLTKDKKGRIKSYTIVKNTNYYQTQPLLDKITFKFYDSLEQVIDALKNKHILGIQFIPQKLKEQITDIKNVQTHSLTFPQYTAVFFNESENIFLEDQKLREALRLAIHKDKIVSYALDGEGEPLSSPFLKGFIGYDEQHQDVAPSTEQANILLDELNYKPIPVTDYIKQIQKERVTETRKKMEQDWKNYQDQLQTEESEKKDSSSKSNKEKDLTIHANDDKNQALEESLSLTNPDDLTDEEILETIDFSDLDFLNQNFIRVKNNELLTIRLTTVDHPENQKTAELIKDDWNKIGITVKLEIIAPQKITEIIKKRQYECLIYGQNVGFDPDPYAFWHSSQINDPGLNLAQFSNKEADQLIVEARETSEKKIREEKYKKFQTILQEEIPAIFLYSPTYTYVLTNKIKGFNIQSIVEPRDRFNNLEEWYIKTKRIKKESR